MRFRSCLLLSRFFVFAFPLAVQKEWNSEASHKPGEVLSVRDDTDSSNDFTVALANSNGQNLFDQPPPEESKPLSTYNQPLNKVPSGLPDLGTGSLQAQSIVDELGHGGTAVFGAGVGGVLNLINGAVQNINTDPSTPTVPAPLGFKKGGTTQQQQRETVRTGRFRSGTMTRLRGPGDIIGNWGAGGGGMCSSSEFGNRNIVWCDYGDWQTAELTNDKKITVFGYPCT